MQDRVLGLGQLPRSGGLAPRGSGSPDADPHTDDAERRTRVGSTPLFRKGGEWATWLVFLFLAYVLIRVVVR